MPAKCGARFRIGFCCWWNGGKEQEIDCRCKFYLNQKHPGCKKRSGQELKKKKKGLDKKEVKSKWAAKACVVLLLMEIKILIITSQAAKH